MGFWTNSAFWVLFGLTMVGCAANILPAIFTKKPFAEQGYYRYFWLIWWILMLSREVIDPQRTLRWWWVISVVLMAVANAWGIRILKKRGMYKKEFLRRPSTAGVIDWECPVCGKQNDRWYVSCHHCGADRPDGSAVTEDKNDRDTVKEGGNDS